MTRPIKAFIEELTEILEDIKNNEKVNPNDKTNGFSDTFTLQNELDYFEKIKKELEEKKTQDREKKLTQFEIRQQDDRLWKLLRKDRRVSKVTTDIKRVLANIREERKVINKFNSNIAECQHKYELFKKIHLGLLKDLVEINSTIEDIKEDVPLNLNSYWSDYLITKFDPSRVKCTLRRPWLEILRSVFSSLAVQGSPVYLSLS